MSDVIAYLGEWIKHIVLIILIATFLDLLLPNSQMRRYIKLVVGLLIIMTILSPVLELLTYDPEHMLREVEQMFEQQPGYELDIEREREKIEQVQQEAVLQEVERLWAKEIIRDLEDQFSLSVHHLDLALGMEDGEVNVSQLVVAVTTSEGETAEGERGDMTDSPDKTTVQPVEPVVVEVGGEAAPSGPGERSAVEGAIEEKVLTYFDWKWNISEDKIDFSWFGR
ncbi:stage III sporulation protein AF [Caldalkalibacillus uzonensis]|uniref:Stage III sporulation protein AF n=1 Tax=Caldalkalibacillus uzonensis TaxID=353224 RepID=A0ABU0CMU2_9BACI|nr:stage III sporulation protein AF [Caldalkalibacillus uzonensis]MDQ0337734.1 stage III sporulation protein AF [Caldalkalibacillus uzonensis]